MLNAAFFNAASANVLDFDDTHLRTVIHPAPPVAPALLALAEQRRIGGDALLHALVLGIETACRIGNAVSPHHYTSGWHITSSCGVFGAAAGAGKLLGLDQERMAWALGNAMAQSAGLVESLGSMAKSLSVGNAARNGLAAALLAEAGFTGSRTALEGRYGFAAVMAGKADFAAVTDGLGANWEILDNAYKPYPCGVVLFPVIDACLELRERHAVDPRQITRIAVRGNPLLRIRTDRPSVTTGREAKVSLHHTVAAAFLDGAVGIRHYTDDCVAEPAYRALRQKVEMVEDAAIPVETAIVTLTLEGGNTLSAQVDRPRGTKLRPMSDSELDAKFRDQAQLAAPAVDTGRLLAALWAIDRDGDAGRVMAFAVPPGSA
jgi:2-methylcitrate dehydratase PrpD